MSASANVVRSANGGALRVVVADITLDSSYPTGGYTINAATFGRPGEIVYSLDASNRGGYVIEYDQVNGKLLVLRVGASVSNPLSEVPAATNLSTVTTRAVAIVG